MKFVDINSIFLLYGYLVVFDVIRQYQTFFDEKLRRKERILDEILEIVVTKDHEYRLTDRLVKPVSVA